MRFVSVFFLVVVLGCSAGSPASGEDGRVDAPGSTAAAEVPAPHPLSIEALRADDYSSGALKVLGEIPANPGLRAFDFSYESDGNRVYGLIERPDREAPVGGWPVLVVSHGYIPPDQYDTESSYRLVTQYYAAGGFLVVKPDYRGHGRSEGQTQSPARTVLYTRDVLNLLAGIDLIPDADPDTVYLYGHSMGGEIGLRILVVNDALKGATLWASVTQPFPENTLHYVRRRGGAEVVRYLETLAELVPEEAYASISPLNFLDDVSVPVLVHHGTADESVPFEWSLPFREALNAAGVDYRFYEYPGENHNISSSFYRVMDADMVFFRGL